MKTMKRMLAGLILGTGLSLAQAAAAQVTNETPPVSFAGTFEVAGGTAASAAGKATFTVQKSMVTVETERYKVDVLDMGIAQILDKRSGRSYCRPDGAKPGRRATLFLRDFRPGQPARTYVHAPEEAGLQQTFVRRLPSGVEYTVTGLVCPGDSAQPYGAGNMLGLRIEYDNTTGDLVLTPLAKVGQPKQFAVLSEGIFAVGFDMGPFAADAIRLLHPDGTTQLVEKVELPGAMWPVDYPAGLLLFQAPGGECVSLWANDPKMEFGKRFRCKKGVFSVDTISGDAPWRTGVLAAPIWRLNLFDSWEAAAARYRGLMERNLGVVPLERREPAWAKKLRLITHQVSGNDNLNRQYLDRGVPAETMLEWDTPQGWPAGYGPDAASAKRGEWRPVYPSENLAGGDGWSDYATSVKARQDLGVSVFPYTCMFTFLPDAFGNVTKAMRTPDMDFEGGGRIWWVLYANMVDDLVKKYGVRGIYGDCSGIGPKYDPMGKVDGSTVWQAHVLGRRYLLARMPAVAFMGERQHEITMISDVIAMVSAEGERHPINSYLFGPYSLRFNLASEQQRTKLAARGLADTGPLHEALDAEESLVCIPMLSNNRPLVSPARQETALVKRRVFFWAQQMLTPYFPEKYEPGVVAYLRGKDGSEYRTRNVGGMGLVRQKPGAEEVVWWRTRNVSEFACPKAAIEGWVAYSGDNAIGLNPEHRYVALDEIVRPPVTISQMPKGVFLALSRVEDGYWVANIGGKDLPAAVELTVSSGGKQVSFVGAEVLDGKKDADSYRIRVAPDCMFAAIWDCAPKVVSMLPFEFGAPSSRLQFVGESGVPDVSQDVPKEPAPSSRLQLSWDLMLKKHSLQADYLVTLPRTPAALETRVKTGNGGVARLRINGKVAAEARGTAENTSPILNASLAAFAGQTVLLTFDSVIEDKAVIDAPSLAAAGAAEVAAAAQSPAAPGPANVVDIKSVPPWIFAAAGASVLAVIVLLIALKAGKRSKPQKYSAAARTTPAPPAGKVAGKKPVSAPVRPAGASQAPLQDKGPAGKGPQSGAGGAGRKIVVRSRRPDQP